MRIRIALGLGQVAALALAALVAVLSPGFAAAGASGTQAEPDFAPAGEASVHPGVVTNTEGGQCTSNFVFTDGSDVFLGQAAHCAGTGAPTQTNGCNANSKPLGTEVRIQGAEHPGTLVYSSWLAMQRIDEDTRNICRFNDFALVKLDPRDVDNANPTVPFFGGPTGLDTDGVPAGQTVYSYGNSPLRVGPLNALNPKIGKSIGTQSGGWVHQVFTLTPGVPGDSGSGFLDANGSAFGVLSTLALAPVPASNGVTDLAKALEYANEHGKRVDATVRLVEGTEPFEAPALPLPIGLGNNLL